MSTVAFPKLGLEFEINPVAFSIGDFDIAWYAIIIAVGFLLAVLYGMHRMRDFGLDEDRAFDAIIAGMIGGIVGARLYYVAFSWDNYKDDLLSILDTRSGGLAIYGGIIGALLVGGIVCKIRKVKLLPMFDVTVLGFLIGQCIGRWGNFVNVEAYGSETDWVFGMISTGDVSIVSPVHPCFLYESVWCLIGFILLHFYSKRRKFDGEVTLLYLMWYGFGRMFIEGLRQDSLYWGPFRVSQMLSGLLVIAATITWLVVRSNIKRNNDPEYLKLYVNTEESKELLRQADEKINKKYAKKDSAAEKPAEETAAEEETETSEEKTEIIENAAIDEPEIEEEKENGESH